MADRDGEWVRYRRSPDGRIEAMRARFRGHSYHRHSHETYSFGVTEAGAQSFRCRRAEHTSVAGMVMAFNPDDPHDGHATHRDGFTYRMLHLAPELVAGVLAEESRRPAQLPLFVQPVIHDPTLARSIVRVHEAISHGTALERGERLTAAILELARRGSTRATRSVDALGLRDSATAEIAAHARAVIEDTFALDMDAEALAAAVGCSRYGVYRAFQARYGLAPSEYQRQLRLRAARRLLREGMGPAQVAAEVGFADQAHLNRWFVHWFAVTPGAYRRADRLLVRFFAGGADTKSMPRWTQAASEASVS